MISRPFSRGHDDADDGAGDPGAEQASPNEEAIAALVHDLLVELGEDPTRDGLLDTPVRMARSLAFLTSGYDKTLDSVVKHALYSEPYDDLVLVRDIEFYSLCEHHVLPFFGRVHIAYRPNGVVVGLSKLPRIVEMFARRLQVQERLTREIAEAVQEATTARGVGVVIEAEHLCMAMRGVRKPGSTTVTTALLGDLDGDPARRAEFLALVRPGGERR